MRLFNFLFFGLLSILPVKKEYSDQIKVPSDMDRIAFEALQRINPVSIKHDWEYGGLIYIDTLGNIQATHPVTDESSHTVMINPLHRFGLKGKTVARYHTHAAKSKDYLDEEFSEQDTGFVTVDQYLMTPGYNFLKFDHVSRTVYKYSRKNNIWIEIKPKPSQDEKPLPQNPKLYLYDKIPSVILNQ